MDLKISKDKASELAFRFSKEYVEGKIEFLEWKPTGRENAGVLRSLGT